MSWTPNEGDSWITSSHIPAVLSSAAAKARRPEIALTSPPAGYSAYGWRYAEIDTALASFAVSSASVQDSEVLIGERTIRCTHALVAALAEQQASFLAENVLRLRDTLESILPDRIAGPIVLSTEEEMDRPFEYSIAPMVAIDAADLRPHDHDWVAAEHKLMRRICYAWWRSTRNIVGNYATELVLAIATAAALRAGIVTSSEQRVRPLLAFYEELSRQAVRGRIQERLQGINNHVVAKWTRELFEKFRSGDLALLRELSTDAIRSVVTTSEATEALGISPS